MEAPTKTISINIRTDEDTKSSFSKLCKDLGLSVSSALNMIMKSAVRNREIPVKLTTATKVAAHNDTAHNDTAHNDLADDEGLFASQEEGEKEIVPGENYTDEELHDRLKKWEAKYGFKD